MTSWISTVMLQFGYLGVGLLTLLETVFPPIPSELILPFAGYLAAEGQLGLIGVIVAGTLGSTTGATALYEAGRRIGEERIKRFAARHGRWLTLSPGDIERAGAWFSRHGAWTVFLCRLVPGLRSLISIPAGINRMPFLLFAGCTALGSLLWSSLLVGGGYLLGAHFEQIGNWIGPISNAVIVAILLWYLWRVFVAHRRA